MSFSGMLRRVILVRKNVRRLLVTSNVVSSSPIPVTLMMEALRCSEMSVLTRVTRRKIAEDGTHYGLKLFTELHGVHEVSLTHLTNPTLPIRSGGTNVANPTEIGCNVVNSCADIQN
jgi:hypothetical protein